jgi:hypothetical protein
MFQESVSANRLLIIVCAYYVLLLGAIAGIVFAKPETLPLLPVGGNDVLEIVGIESEGQTFLDQLGPSTSVIEMPATTRQVGLLTLFLAFSLGGTILVMLPVTWTYGAIKSEIGYRKSFARALLVLPICATTTVLLIQNNLALAFGLAAMVAAVRFRVALQEAIDGIFIFASICVGLAAGIGHLGIAIVMALVFCLTNTVLWKMDFGRNPMDDLRVAKKNAKLKGLPQPPDAP